MFAVTSLTMKIKIVKYWSNALNHETAKFSTLKISRPTVVIQTYIRIFRFIVQNKLRLQAVFFMHFCIINSFDLVILLSPSTVRPEVCNYSKLTWYVTRSLYPFSVILYGVQWRCKHNLKLVCFSIVPYILFVCKSKLSYKHTICFPLFWEIFILV